jgi:hypothetical protein
LRNIKILKIKPTRYEYNAYGYSDYNLCFTRLIWTNFYVIITATDITKLNADFAALQADATANNAAQFKTDSQKFTSDQRTANLDAVTAITTTHSTTVNAALKSEASQLQSTEKSCLFAAKQQKAQVKVHSYTKAITNAQNLSDRLTKHGANTGALNQTIANANSQIQAFQTAVNNAQNSTQLQAALNSFCLYNGYKTDNNFHFAANVGIQADQEKLNLLSGKNSTSSFQALVSQAQSYITNAQTALTQEDLTSIKEHNPTLFGIILRQQQM